MTAPIYFYKVKNLVNLNPNSLVALKEDNDLYFSLYVTDKDGLPYSIKGLGDDVVKAVESGDGNLIITGDTTKIINVSPALLNLINTALRPGDNVSDLINDANYITLAEVPVFNPIDYDLEDFNNSSTDPFVKNSELSDVAYSGNYSDLQGTPIEFPPVSHTHTTSQITDFPTFKTIENQSIIGTGNIDLSNGGVYWVNGSPGAVGGLSIETSTNLETHILIEGNLTGNAWAFPTTGTPYYVSINNALFTSTSIWRGLSYNYSSNVLTFLSDGVVTGTVTPPLQLSSLSNFANSLQNGYVRRALVWKKVLDNTQRLSIISNNGVGDGSVFFGPHRPFARYEPENIAYNGTSSIWYDTSGNENDAIIFGQMVNPTPWVAQIPTVDQTLIDGSTNAISNNAVFDALVSKADSVHQHTITDITGLSSALSGKEPTIPTGTSAQYIKGDKTLGNFPTVDQTLIDGSTNAVSGNAVYDALSLAAQQLELKSENSASALSGFEITNNGNGTLNINGGVALLRDQNDPYAILQKYTISGVTNLAMVDNTNNFVLVDYNSGTPAIIVTQNPDTINGRTNSIIAGVSRVGTTVDFISLVGQGVDSWQKIRSRFLDTETVTRAKGLELGASGLAISCTPGIAYAGLNKLPVSLLNTHTQAYKTGSTWVRTPGLTNLNNTQYNNAGTLTTLTNGRFRVDYVYVLVDNPSKLYTIMGEVQYNTIADARLAPAPATLPTELQFLGTRVGRVIVERNATTVEVSSEFNTVYRAGSVQNHNDLALLNTGDYNHFRATTSADAGKVLAVNSSGNVDFLNGVGNLNINSKLTVGDEVTNGHHYIELLGKNASNIAEMQGIQAGGGAASIRVQKNGGNLVFGTLVDNTVDKVQSDGSILATAFKKSGATANNILLAGGGDIAQSTFASTTHTHAISDISGLQTELNNKENTANKNAVNGYAGLDGSGRINPLQLPALAITDTFVVANQAAMLALTAEVGDVAVRTDLNKSFILRVTGASTLANWQELLTPTDAVSSVFGRSGVVTAQANDYNTSLVPENTNLYFTEGRVRNTPLTGYVSGAGTVAATDTLLQAIQKLNGNITNATHNPVTLGTANGLSLSTQQLSLGLASSGVTGALSGTDWNTFNNKANANGSNASGTWGINITGSASSASSTPLVSVDSSMLFGRNGLQYFNVSGLSGDNPATTNTPDDNWWHIIRGNHGNGAGYYTDLALPMTSDGKIRYRRISGGVSYGWTTLIDSSTIGNQSVNYANSSGTSSQMSNSGVSFTNASGWGRVTTLSGYIDFGPANASHAHIYTDRPTFYFNKDLQVNGATVITSSTIGGQSVNYATSAGTAGSAGSAPHLTTNYAGGVQTNPQTYFNYSIGLKVAMTGFPSTWADTLWINGYSGGDVPDMCALHFLRNGQPRAFISSQQHSSASYGTTYELITDYNLSGKALRKGSDSNGGSYQLYSTDASGQYNTRALEIREVNLATTGNITPEYAPAIGFHWGGITQNKLLLRNDGQLAVSDVSNSWGNPLIHSGNIGSQSVSYATTAGSANSVAWGNVSSRPTNLSQFTNDLGNYGGWITSSGSISGNAATVTINYNNDSNSTYQMLWGSGNSVFGTGSIYCNPSTDALYAKIFYDADNSAYYFDGSSTGDSIRVAGDIVAYFSDERLKDRKENISNALSKVMSLNGFYYTPNAKAQELGYVYREEVGVSAQEVERVLPEIIKSAPISDEYKTLDYGKLTPLLIEAIKEQQQQIELLKTQVQTLLNKQ